MTSSRSLFKNQDYYKIKKECLKSNELFYDDLFNLDVKNAIWLRPKIIIKDPKFFVEGASRFDVVQGSNEDCWLVVAMANLTMNPTLFHRVVPKDQSFTESYAGIFRFNIWQCGKWVEVVVDDRLPTNDGKLKFLHSRQKNEFWSALLEKAYAKLYGSYNELTSGWFNEAMVDFTGGVVERVKLTPTPENLETIIRTSLEKSSFMCVFMFDDPSIKEMLTLDGLVKGHAYSINKAQSVSPSDGTESIVLVRLRNPWGKVEWEGAWSDSSPEWESIPSEERKKIGLVFENDGEFWMSLSDFSTHFEHIDICHLSPDIFSNFDESVKIGWESKSFKGEWSKHVTAGGFYLETFHLNPQYRITLTDSNDEDKLSTVIVALMQRNKSRKVWHRIGFTTFYLEGPEKLSKKPLSRSYIKKHFENSASSKFKECRENVVRDTWKPGEYCIIPSTFTPNIEGRFLLRVYSEKETAMEESEIIEEVSEPTVTEEPPEPNEPIQERKDTQRIKGNKLLQRNDQEILEFFHKTAGNESEIGWQELQTILDYAMNNAQTTETVSTGFFSMVISYLSSFFVSSSDNNTFTKDECRNMIDMLDDDDSGRLNFREFQILLKRFRSWESAFLNYSIESGIEARDLNKALSEIGYNAKNSDVSRLVRRYSNSDGKLAFNDFVMCAIELIKIGTS